MARRIGQQLGLGWQSGPSSPRAGQQSEPAKIFDDLLKDLGKAHQEQVQRYEKSLLERDKEIGRLKLLLQNERRGSHHSEEASHAQESEQCHEVDVLSKLEDVSSPTALFPLLEGWRRSITKSEGLQKSHTNLICDKPSKKMHETGTSSHTIGHEHHDAPCYIMLPSSPFRVCWDIAGLLLILYDLFSIPHSVAFQPDDDVVSITLNWVTLLFWTSDLLQSFFLAYYKEGLVISNHREIVKHYLATWFIVDCFIVIPEWVMVCMNFFEATSGEYGDLSKILKIVRFARVLRLLRLLKMKKLLNLIADMIESEYTFILFNLLQLFAFVIMMNHVIACMWFLCARLVFEQNDGRSTWVTVAGLADEDLGYLYTTSLHWSLTQFTPASMDISARNNPERVFSIVILLFAMLIFSSIIASITASMTALRNLRGDELRQFWLLRRYLRQRQVTKGLSSRILKFLEHHVNNMSNMVQREKIPVLSALSEALQNELTHQMHSPQLISHHFFGFLNAEMPVVMHRLCRVALKLQTFAEKEAAFATGDEAKRMLFIKSGVFEYAIFSGEVLNPPPLPKEWLSEAALYTPWRHRGDLMSENEAEAISVDPEHFMKVMSTHPRPWNFAQTYAAKFIRMLTSTPRTELHDIIRNPQWYQNAAVESDAEWHPPSGEVAVEKAPTNISDSSTRRAAFAFWSSSGVGSKPIRGLLAHRPDTPSSGALVHAGTAPILGSSDGRGLGLGLASPFPPSGHINGAGRPTPVPETSNGSSVRPMEGGDSSSSNSPPASPHQQDHIGGRSKGIGLSRGAGAPFSAAEPKVLDCHAPQDRRPGPPAIMETSEGTASVEDVDVQVQGDEIPRSPQSQPPHEMISSSNSPGLEDVPSRHRSSGSSFSLGLPSFGRLAASRRRNVAAAAASEACASASNSGEGTTSSVGQGFAPLAQDGDGHVRMVSGTLGRNQTTGMSQDRNVAADHSSLPLSGGGSRGRPIARGRSAPAPIRPGNLDFSGGRQANLLGGPTALLCGSFCPRGFSAGGPTSPGAFQAPTGSNGSAFE